MSILYHFIPIVSKSPIWMKFGIKLELKFVLKIESFALKNIYACDWRLYSAEAVLFKNIVSKVIKYEQKFHNCPWNWIEDIIDSCIVKNALWNSIWQKFSSLSNFRTVERTTQFVISFDHFSYAKSTSVKVIQDFIKKKAFCTYIQTVTINIGLDWMNRFKLVIYYQNP